MRPEPPPPRRNHVNVRVKVRRRVPEAEVPELLEMLGVIDADGNLLDDDTKDYSAVSLPNASIPRVNRNAPAPGSTAPGTLRQAAPVPAVTKAGVDNLLAANRRKQSPCPSKAARARHKRNGEACPVCQDALEASKRPRPSCGSPGGLMAHRWRGEDVCEPCRLAHNKRQRERT